MLNIELSFKFSDVHDKCCSYYYNMINKLSTPRFVSYWYYIQLGDLFDIIWHLPKLLYFILLH